MKYCCKRFKYAVEYVEISWIEACKEWYVLAEAGCCAVFAINYCPFCGKKL